MEILISFILPFVLLLTIVVFIHEYGHYYFAKKYGVGVTDFSIGFGKELFGFNDKSGTRWKFCAIPLGGYVKFFGDRNVFSQAEQEKLLKEYNEEDQKKLFVIKPIYQRSLIVAAGPFANFVLAIFIFAFIYMFAGKDFTPAQIQEVQKDSPAYIAGIKNGDIISSIDNNKVNSIMEVSTFINTSINDQINIEVLRNEKTLIFSVTPSSLKGKDALGNTINKKIIGIKISPLNDEINRERLGPASALFYAVKETWFVTKASLDFVISLFKVINENLHTKRANCEKYHQCFVSSSDRHARPPDPCPIFTTIHLCRPRRADLACALPMPQRRPTPTAQSKNQNSPGNPGLHGQSAEANRSASALSTWPNRRSSRNRRRHR